jgi:hypothetical protein
MKEQQKNRKNHILKIKNLVFPKMIATAIQNFRKIKTVAVIKRIFGTILRICTKSKSQ